MRVEARRSALDSAPADLQPYIRQVFVKEGHLYAAYGVVIFDGWVTFLIINDLGWPDWTAAWIFDVVDPDVPRDRICMTFREEPSMILGPEFIAWTIQDYNSMVELEPEQVERFWAYVDTKAEGKPPA